jgi:DNA-binding response OmpR family regulator
MEKEQLLKGKKILIVDDEPDILEALEELLSMCQVEKAASFNEAQKKLNTLSFDIAILDIMGVHGYRLLDLTKEKKSSRSC